MRIPYGSEKEGSIMSHATRSKALRVLTVNALFAALICVLSPIAVPIGAVPISLGLLGVLITAATLPPKQSVTAVAVFLALGLCGLPVFSGGNSGAMVFVGPTGGYLWSYLFTALLVSLLCRSATAGKLCTTIACLAGVALCYLCGTLQYCLLTHSTPLSALLVCVLPFLPFDILKSILAALLSARLRRL